MNKIKKIGILTSGGDCGGLNAAIRSIFFSDFWRLFGIKSGPESEFESLNTRKVDFHVNGKKSIF